MLHIDRKPHGTTVSAFTVSLDPPIPGSPPSRSSLLLKIITESGRFRVNVLASGQASLATTTFARKGRYKFDGVAWYMDHD